MGIYIFPIFCFGVLITGIVLVGVLQASDLAKQLAAKGRERDSVLDSPQVVQEEETVVR